MPQSNKIKFDNDDIIKDIQNRYKEERKRKISKTQTISNKASPESKK